MYTIFCGHLFLFLLGPYSGMDMLDTMINVCLIFQESIKSFQSKYTILYFSITILAFLVAQSLKRLPAMWEWSEDLPNPGIEPGSPVLQADALPSEPIPGSGWFAWKRKWQPTPVFLPGEVIPWTVHGINSWWATVHGVTQSLITILVSFAPYILQHLVFFKPNLPFYFSFMVSDFVSWLGNFCLP